MHLVLVRGETPGNNGTTLQLDVHPANSGLLNMKLSKERASEVELPKCVGFQDEVKPFKGPGGIEVLKKLQNVGEDPGHSEGAEEREGRAECVSRLTTCQRVEFEVIQGTVIYNVSWIRPATSRGRREGLCRRWKGV